MIQAVLHACVMPLHTGADSLLSGLQRWLSPLSLDELKVSKDSNKAALLQPLFVAGY